MKKIVINTCFGGFGLSVEAQRRYLELKGKKAYFFKTNLESGLHSPLENPEGELFVSTFTVPNPDDYIKKDKPWDEMTQKEKDEYTEKYDDISFYYGELKRDDPLLIQVVEEFGKRANGKCAELKIVEIPNDVDWIIDDYDGVEHVAEKHRTWY